MKMSSNLMERRKIMGGEQGGGGASANFVGARKYKNSKGWSRKKTVDWLTGTARNKIQQQKGEKKGGAAPEDSSALAVGAERKGGGREGVSGSTHLKKYGRHARPIY